MQNNGLLKWFKYSFCNFKSSHDNSVKNIWTHNKYLFTFFGFVLIVCACFTITISIMPSVSANETRGNVDYSLAKVSAAAALYLNTMNAAEYEGCNELAGHLIPGNAGGLVGAFDTDAYDKMYGVAERETTNVLVYSYEALARIREGESMNAFIGDSPRVYGLYGYMLEQLGLDESTVGASNNSLRFIIGIIFMAAYVLSIGMPMFFNLILAFLQAINPFGMFARAAALSAHSSAAKVGDGVVPGFSDVGGVQASSVLDDFMENIGAIYDVLYNMSFAIMIPVFVAFALFTWLVINKGHNAGKVFKPLVIRVLFILIGVPFMFSLYDVVLTSARGTIKPGDSPATTIVGSLFCDFQSWVYASEDGGDNIKLPGSYDYTITKTGYAVSAKTASLARQICYAVNKESGGDLFGAVANLDAQPGIKAYTTYDEKILSDTSKPTYEVGNTTYDRGISVDAAQVAGIIDILTRYSTGQVVSSADYSSAVVRKLLSESDAGDVIKLFNTSSSWENYEDKAAETFEYNGNDGGAAGNSNKNSSLGDGDENGILLDQEDVKRIAATRWENGASDFYGQAGQIFVNGTLNSDGAAGEYNRRVNDNSYKFNPGGGLSTLSMYNYLNSRFTSSGVHVSSPTATANDQVKFEHYAVNIVGVGVLRFVYIADALCLLAAMSVIGYGYGFSMFFANFRALVQMVPKVLTGMIGSMRGIAGALALTFALIAEVVATVVLFDVSVTLIYSIYGLIEAPLATMLNHFSLDTGVGGILLIAVLGIITVVVILFAIKKLLEWRHAVIGGIVNASTEFINKLIGVQVSAPDIDMPITSAADKVLMAAGAAYGVATYAGGSALINNNSDKSGLAGAKEQLSNTMGNINASLGVKKGNGTALSTGLSDSVSGQISDAFDKAEGGSGKGNKSGKSGKVSSSGVKVDPDAVKKAQRGSERNSNGDTRDPDGADQTEVLSQSVVAAEAPEFEEQMSSLAGDKATSKTLKDYANDDSISLEAPNGTYTWKDSDGKVTHKVTKSVDADGNSVVETVDYNSDGSKQSSKLVDNDLESVATTKDFDKDGQLTSEMTVTDHKDTGNKHVLKKLYTDGKVDVTIEQEHGKDLAGHTTLHQETVQNGVTTIEDTVNYGGGSKDIVQVVSGSGGTSQTNMQIRALASGGFSTNSQSINADGMRVNSSSVTNSNGLVIQSEETIMDNSQHEIRHTQTRVQNTNAKQVTMTRIKEGNSVQNITKTEYNPDSNGVYQNMQMKTSYGGNNTQAKVTVDNYVYDNVTQDYVVNNNVSARAVQGKTSVNNNISTGTTSGSVSVALNRSKASISTADLVKNNNTSTPNGRAVAYPSKRV